MSTQTPSQNSTKKWWLILMIMIGAAILVLSGYMAAKLATSKAYTPTSTPNWQATVVAMQQQLATLQAQQALTAPATLNPPAPQSAAPSAAAPTPPAPAANTTAESTLFGKGTCVIEGKTYDLSSDTSAVWMDGALLEALINHGGVCSVTTYKRGWYWSVAGRITRNNVVMANGNRLNAEPGKWVFEYPAPPGEKRDNYGFIFRDNVPGN